MLQIFSARAEKHNPDNTGTANFSENIIANYANGIDIKILATYNATFNSES